MQQWRPDTLMPPPPPEARRYNVNAPAFVPQQQVKSVYAKAMEKRMCVDKQSRYDRAKPPYKRDPLKVASSNTLPFAPSQTEEDGGVRIDNVLDEEDLRAAIAQKVHERRKQAAFKHWKTDQTSQSQPQFKVAIRPGEERSKVATKYLLPRPVPAAGYTKQANIPATISDKCQPLLVILDLNGTLLYRKSRGSEFIARPKVCEFLQYLFANHKTMVWSSAQPKNVHGMADRLFTAEEKQNVAAIWTRDDLRLSPAQYREKVQVYKRLSWVWADDGIQASHPDSQGVWTQADTVLIDDSVEKAASEPHSLIEIEEFEGRYDQMGSDVLGQVVGYLEKLKWQRDVSSYMRSTPFKFVPEETFDWSTVA
jgi:hypothetical protein